MISVGIREPEVIFEVLKRFGNVERSEREYGYFIKVGKVKIEAYRILAEDFVKMMVNEKLVELFNLCRRENEDFTILFIIGVIYPEFHLAFRKESYLNSLIDLILERIIPVNLDSDYDMIIFLKNLHLELESREYIPEIGELVNIRGIGVNRAKILIERFGSVENIAKASLSQLVDKGIGLDVAREIYKYFKEKRNKDNRGNRSGN